MFYNTGINGDYEITNQSTQYSITGFQITGIPAGVTFNLDPDSCIQSVNGVPTSVYLGPGQTCYFDFIANTGTHIVAPVGLTINTLNAGSASVTMQVLGVGDAYNGDVLVQLPVNSATSNLPYYSIPTADTSTATTEDVANSVCAGEGADHSLPTLAQLQSYIFPASNCNPGSLAPGQAPDSPKVPGFTCADDYWSQSEGALNFTTLAVTAPAAANGRCLTDWVLADV